MGKYLKEPQRKVGSPYAMYDTKAPLLSESIPSSRPKKVVQEIVSKKQEIVEDVVRQISKRLNHFGGGSGVHSDLGALGASDGSSLVVNKLDAPHVFAINLHRWIESNGYNVMPFIPTAYWAAIKARSGVPDISSYIQLAIDDMVSNWVEGELKFPRGFYTLASGLSLASVNGIKLVGEGANATSLVVAANSVGAISVSGTSARCGVKGIWIGSFAARTGTTGVSVIGTSSVLPCSEFMIRDVKIQNINNPFVWTDVHQSWIQTVKIVQSIASAVTGVGIHLRGVISTHVSDIDMFATTGTFGNDNVRVDRDCDTVTLTKVAVASTTGRGFHFLNSGGTTGPRLTRAIACYAEECSLGGFLVADGRDVRLDLCESAVNGASGFAVTGGDSVHISNSLSLQNDTYGFVVTGGNGSIRGCTASDNSQTTDNAYDGARIEDNVTHWIVNDNRFGDFIFSLTNDQRYGLSIGSVGTDYIVAKGNDLQGNQSAAMGNFSTGANNDIDEEGSYTGTLTGFTSPPTATLRFRREGRTATVYIPTITGTSNATSCTLTGMPTNILPARAQAFSVLITDNGTNAFGWCSVATSGVMTLAPSAANNASGWTNSGTKAIVEQTVKFSLD